ncbi:hypothetical protein MPH_11898 [Macrophomina phaseolina MS6]|uniref:Uncharacterized protein n=1 Tax=Macrophomina phaseolina (strain MS6) TaxID=1126212 RepID=K2QLX5_MACPH|nr:hypothetical protein MPH_11898 [Macrophomina phaseolina MS6]
MAVLSSARRTSIENAEQNVSFSNQSDRWSMSGKRTVEPFLRRNGFPSHQRVNRARTRGTQSAQASLGGKRNPRAASTPAACYAGSLSSCRCSKMMEAELSPLYLRRARD